jgi:hypothetical protein
MVFLRFFGFALAAAILIVLAAAPGQQASARPRGFAPMITSDAGAPKGYDHLLCYVTKQTAYKDFNVNLIDQFYPNGFNTAIKGVVNACTPAKKTLLYRQPITGFTWDGHYVCYPINNIPPAVNLTTVYNNQLQKSSIIWSYPVVLCVPSQKYLYTPPPSPEPTGPPAGYTHLMLYSNAVYDNGYYGVTFANPLQATTVTIYDQFYPNGFTTALGNPAFLLTPTKKHYKKPRKVMTNGHWALYYFTPPPLVSQTRNYVNQLEENQLTAHFPDWLLVPTYKYKPRKESLLQGQLQSSAYSIFLPNHSP